MKKNIRGSGIIWAIAAIMILSVIVSGALTFAYYNFNSTMVNADRAQLELETKAAASSVVEALEQGHSLSVLIPDKVGDKKDITITLPAEMHPVNRAYIERLTDTSIQIYVEMESMRNMIRTKAYMDYTNAKWVLNYYDGGGASS